jgi:hypothetical protein
LEALINYKQSESEARIFFLNEGGARALFWAAAIIVSRIRMYQIILDTKGPFFANIARETGQLVTELRTPFDTANGQTDAEPAKPVLSDADFVKC